MAGAGEHDSHASISGTIRLAGGPSNLAGSHPQINLQVYLFFYQAARSFFVYPRSKNQASFTKLLTAEAASSYVL